ncbi:MAG: TetR/AcrR family transcriptional regulator [Thermaceae bacterium]|nr:TetR/AcrR family transcriptional regulator [Thermaceae bacterium]
MGRISNPDAKAEFLEGAVEYLLRGGLQDLSLRPLAEALGTNARMLLYYFGSKENLIVEALTAAQARQQAFLQAQPQSSADPVAGLRRFWNWFSSPELAPYARLLYEIEVLGLKGNAEYQNFAKAAIHGWISFVQQGLGAAPAQASLIVSVFSGLLIDRLITGETERVNAVFEAFVKALERGEAI